MQVRFKGNYYTSIERDVSYTFPSLIGIFLKKIYLQFCALIWILLQPMWAASWAWAWAAASSASPSSSSSPSGDSCVRERRRTSKTWPHEKCFPNNYLKFRVSDVFFFRRNMSFTYPATWNNLQGEGPLRTMHTFFGEANDTWNEICASENSAVFPLSTVITHTECVNITILKE